MWTSERNRNLQVREPAAEMGTITMGGDPAGVNLGGERRWLNVYGPGGYSWRPTAGDKVLVLKTGAEGESPCILGTAQEGEDLKPGEVRLTGLECSLRLGQGQRFQFVQQRPVHVKHHTFQHIHPPFLFCQYSRFHPMAQGRFFRIFS